LIGKVDRLQGAASLIRTVCPPRRLGSSCLVPGCVDARRYAMGTEETNLPKLAAPARRALHGAGYTRLEDLTKVTESEVMRLHGMGANAMQVLRNALRERGLSFRDG
jgi:hypothetical protein